MIGGTKVVLDAVAFPFKGIFAGAAMEMAINHIAHPMGFQQLCKAAGLAFFVEGGIMEHTDLGRFGGAACKESSRRMHSRS